MKTYLKESIQAALKQLIEEGALILDEIPDIQIQYSKDKQHGDFASNIAMFIAKLAKKSPLQIAGLIIDRLAPSPKIVRVEVAHPGFINFFISEETFQPFISEILT